MHTRFFFSTKCATEPLVREENILTLKLQSLSPSKSTLKLQRLKCFLYATWSSRGPSLFPWPAADLEGSDGRI